MTTATGCLQPHCSEIMYATTALRTTLLRPAVRRLSSQANNNGSWQRFWAWTLQQRPSWKEDKLEAAAYGRSDR